MKQATGLTLIEVLVALAIVAIAMTAIIKATAQNIRATAHLQTKTTANWVAELILNEVKVGLVKVPPSSEGLNAKMDMLGNEWYWQVQSSATPNPRIKKINVRVYQYEPTDANASTITQLDGYAYVENKE